jgi:hypothetical protein
MKLIAIAILTLTSGVNVEVEVEAHVCAKLQRDLEHGATVELEDEAGVMSFVGAVECVPSDGEFSL